MSRFLGQAGTLAASSSEADVAEWGVTPTAGLAPSHAGGRLRIRRHGRRGLHSAPAGSLSPWVDTRRIRWRGPLPSAVLTATPWCWAARPPCRRHRLRDAMPQRIVAERRSIVASLMKQDGHAAGGAQRILPRFSAPRSRRASRVSPGPGAVPHTTAVHERLYGTRRIHLGRIPGCPLTPTHRIDMRLDAGGRARDNRPVRPGETLPRPSLTPLDLS